MVAMSPVIRAARIDREPLVLALGAQQHPMPGTAPAAEPSAAAPDVAAQRPLPAPSPPVVSDAVRLAEQERLQRESISAERQRVLERAREQGHQAGVEQGRAEYATQLEAVRKLLGSMQAALIDGISGTEDLIVEIAFEAVGKILGEALAQREGVQAAVREVIRGVHDREHLVVRVSPRDHQLLAGVGILPKNGDEHRLELIADERVELGGCLIETSGGTLDGRLETQLQRLRDTLVSAGGTLASEAGT
jgi:flagellar biosynthesis/type III secretory pathway protein FliH